MSKCFIPFVPAARGCTAPPCPIITTATYDTGTSTITITGSNFDRATTYIGLTFSGTDISVLPPGTVGVVNTGTTITISPPAITAGTNVFNVFLSNCCMTGSVVSVG